ncbi:MAG: aldo/keto reductase [Firmicutes bacterium]|nr:aldo/keto reductase [Bacillota bacterium]
MEIRSLGRSGLKVTNLCLGTMTFGNQADKRTAFAIMDKAFEAVEKYRLWCSEHGYDMTTTAVRWVIQQPGITSALIGASRPEQLNASLAAAEQPLLGEEDLQWLDQLWFSLPRRREDR